MALRQFIARLTGAAPATNIHEAEYRQRSEAGDEARRRHDYAAAEAHYREGVNLARAYQDAHAVEVFLGLLGALYTEQGRYDEAMPPLTEALTSAGSATEVFRKARAALNMGAFHLLRGADQESQRYLEDAISLGRQASDHVTFSLATCNLADLYMRQGNPGYAMRLLRDALPQTLNHPQQASNLLGRLGRAHLALGEVERGRTTLTQALTFAEQHGQRDLEARWLTLLAERAYQDGQLHDALRYYARLDDLAAQGDLAATSPDFQRRAAAQQAYAHLLLGNADQALSVGERALRLAQAAQDVAGQAEVLLTLGNAHQRQGRPADAEQALDQAVALYATLEGEPGQDAEQARRNHVKALTALGTVYQDQDQVERAIQQFETALALADEGDLIGRAGTLRNIGGLAHKQGNLASAIEKWVEALSLYERANATAQVARLLCDIGAARRQLSGINAALPDFERATVLLNTVKDANTRGYVLSNVANLYTDLGEVETAKAFYQESIHLARGAANRRAESLRLGNFGWFYILTGQPAEGLRLLEESLTISRALNDRLLMAVQTSNMGLAHHDMREYSLAEFAFRDAIITAEKLGEARWAATFRSNLGRTLLAQGKVDEALSTLESVLAVLRTLNDQEVLSRTLVRLADVYLQLGRLDQAEATNAEGEGLARKWGYRKGHADALLVRARIAKAQGKDADYLDALREAHKLYTILHDPIANDLARVLNPASATSS